MIIAIDTENMRAGEVVTYPGYHLLDGGYVKPSKEVVWGDPPKLGEALIEIIQQYRDWNESCSYDHHGYCQTHYLNDAPCPYGILLSSGPNQDS